MYLCCMHTKKTSTIHNMYLFVCIHERYILWIVLVSFLYAYKNTCYELCLFASLLLCIQRTNAVGPALPIQGGATIMEGRLENLETTIPNMYPFLYAYKKRQFITCTFCMHTKKKLTQFITCTCFVCIRKRYMLWTVLVSFLHAYKKGACYELC